MTELLERARAALHALPGRKRGASSEQRAYRVPGRLEFLGKHTDYAGGRSLVAALERGLRVVAAPRADARLRVVDAATGETAELELRPDLQARAGHWTTYPATVARRLARNFPGSPALRGADLAFASDLPRAAGLSSSSALIVAVYTALADVNALDRRPAYVSQIHGAEDLAGYLGAVENGATFGAFTGDTGVGTQGGSQDHTAILCSRAGFLGQYSFCPVHHERDVPFPPGWTLAVAVSGVAADKTGGARERYNRASAAVATMLTAWRAATGRNDASLAAALASAPDAPERLRGLVDPSLRPRLDQFIAESEEIIPAAGDALGRGDVPALGPLVDRSQRLAEESLGNQVPETISLARRARALGAGAASAFGAGFGGSVWALVETRDGEEFLDGWRGAYRREFTEAEERAEFFFTGAAEGMRRE